MSKKRHILDGTKTKNLFKDYGLIYSCKCGWIDLGHLNPSNSRIEVGAENLWTQIKSEGEALRRNSCGNTNLGKNIVGKIVENSGLLQKCIDDPYLKFSDGKTGFLVRYRQDHAGYVGKPGVEKRYIVKHGLTLDQKKKVALSIFMEVSYGFESFQSMFSFITDSGFSQEDLVSNLIGFYIGIGEVNRLDALRSCEPTTDKLARIIWDNEGAVGSNKNRKWNPKYASSTYVETTKQCMDECLSETKELPPKFKRIKPSIKGLHHQELKLM